MLICSGHHALAATLTILLSWTAPVSSTDSPRRDRLLRVDQRPVVSDGHAPDGEAQFRDVGMEDRRVAVPADGVVQEQSSHVADPSTVTPPAKASRGADHSNSMDGAVGDRPEYSSDTLNKRAQTESGLLTPGSEVGEWRQVSNLQLEAVSSKPAVATKHKASKKPVDEKTAHVDGKQQRMKSQVKIGAKVDAKADDKLVKQTVKTHQQANHEKELKDEQHVKDAKDAAEEDDESVDTVVEEKPADDGRAWTGDDVEDRHLKVEREASEDDVEDRHQEVEREASEDDVEDRHQAVEREASKDDVEDRHEKVEREASEEDAAAQHQDKTEGERALLARRKRAKAKSPWGTNPEPPGGLEKMREVEEEMQKELGGFGKNGTNETLTNKTTKNFDKKRDPNYLKMHHEEAEEEEDVEKNQTTMQKALSKRRRAKANGTNGTNGTNETGYEHGTKVGPVDNHWDKVLGRLAKATETRPLETPLCIGACCDNQNFVDQFNGICKDWKGYECQSAHIWGYSLIGKKTVLANCKATCGLCDVDPAEDEGWAANTSVGTSGSENNTVMAGLEELSATDEGDPNWDSSVPEGRLSPSEMKIRKQIRDEGQKVESQFPHEDKVRRARENAIAVVRQRGGMKSPEENAEMGREVDRKQKAKLRAQKGLYGVDNERNGEGGWAESSEGEDVDEKKPSVEEHTRHANRNDKALSPQQRAMYANRRKGSVTKHPISSVHRVRHLKVRSLDDPEQDDAENSDGSAHTDSVGDSDNTAKADGADDSDDTAKAGVSPMGFKAETGVSDDSDDTAKADGADDSDDAGGNSSSTADGPGRTSTGDAPSRSVIKKDAPTEMSKRKKRKKDEPKNDVDTMDYGSGSAKTARESPKLGSAGRRRTAVAK